MLAAYGPDRILAGEAWVEPLSKLAAWVRPDEMHQTFNFSYLETPWKAAALRAVVDESLAAFGSGRGPEHLGALEPRHDPPRHPLRAHPAAAAGPGHRPAFGHPDEVVGLRRARAATAFMLALPGSSYLYQGEELGLPEVIDLPDEARQDPTFFRTAGENYGRDGCRVPLPWTAGAPSAGFGPTEASWLPQPDGWSAYARDTQVGVDGSTLEFYRGAIAARREHELAIETLEWLPTDDDAVLSFRSGAVTVVANTGAASVPLPEGRVIVASGEHAAGDPARRHHRVAARRIGVLRRR